MSLIFFTKRFHYSKWGKYLASLPDQFNRDITRLKRLYNTCVQENRPGKRRFAFYDYLYQVYAVYCKWRADFSTAEIKANLANELDARSETDVRALKLMIDASCSADHKTRCRWGQALRYVWRQRNCKISSREQFDDFLGRKGGVSGCASKIARVRFKRLEGQLAAGHFWQRHLLR
jgi:hypothetical protein